VVSLGLQYFEDLYSADPDPWRFATRWYEKRKYAVTLAALPRARYRRAFEPGCSIGVLTAELAVRCDRLLAADPVPAAIACAQARLVGRRGVRVIRGSVPQDWPDGRFDLVVLSEVLYYLDRAALTRTISLAVNSLERGGDLVAVHWTTRVPEYPLTGPEVHRALHDVPDLTRVVVHDEADFCLEVFRKGEPASVAQVEGLR
jgi:SAM-dependent methyltransferase